MSFFRNLYLKIQGWLGSSKTKRHEFKKSEPDIRMMPAFVPPAPVPIRSGGVQHFKPKRQKDALSGIECTQVGKTVVIACTRRANYRQVTRAIDRVCGAQKKALAHIRQVRMRSVLIHQDDRGIVEKALRGAPYHELRAA